MTSDDVNLLKSLGYTEGSIHYPDDFIYKKDVHRIKYFGINIKNTTQLNRFN